MSEKKHLIDFARKYYINAQKAARPTPISSVFGRAVTCFVYVFSQTLSSHAQAARAAPMRVMVMNLFMVYTVLETVSHTGHDRVRHGFADRDIGDVQTYAPHPETCSDGKV